MDENHYYASILLEDYAGTSGELTAIHQYMYHHLTLQHSHLNISTLIREIAIVEVHHLELLGETIRLLGQFPTCLLYTSPSPRDISGSRMPSSA